MVPYSHDIVADVAMLPTFQKKPPFGYTIWTSFSSPDTAWRMGV